MVSVALFWVQSSMAESQGHVATLVAEASSYSSMTFNPILSVKLDDSNFLLRKQQVEAVIIAHKMHPDRPRPDAIHMVVELDFALCSSSIPQLQAIMAGFG